MTIPRTAPLPAALDRVEGMKTLDRAVTPVEQVVQRVPDGLHRALNGVEWLGHPLHPVLVHLPLGSWMAASAMDAMNKPDAAQTLTVLGVVAAIPTAVAGWADWAYLGNGPKRVGVLHATANTLGLLLYTGSIAARRTGHRRLGRRLGLAGLAAVAVGGAIGGDLAYRRS